uniref:Uncharacterized protein n=1 Tax=Cacopsylla melanoneura TaxID=428564 RepID=A0A8D9FEH1_9HEMI
MYLPLLGRKPTLFFFLQSLSQVMSTTVNIASFSKLSLSMTFLLIVNHVRICRDQTLLIINMCVTCATIGLTKQRIFELIYAATRVRNHLNVDIVRLPVVENPVSMNIEG